MVVFRPALAEADAVNFADEGFGADVNPVHVCVERVEAFKSMSEIIILL